MTVTQIHSHSAEPVQEPVATAPMNSVIYAHVNDATAISAIRRTETGSLELAVGDAFQGTQVVLFLNGDADVIRLIEALQSVYAS